MSLLGYLRNLSEYVLQGITRAVYPDLFARPVKRCGGGAIVSRLLNVPDLALLVISWLDNTDIASFDIAGIYHFSVIYFIASV